MVINVSRDEERLIKVSPVVIQLEMGGYHAGDVRSRILDRNVLSGDIELPGVAATEVVSADRLLIFVEDGHDATEVRREVIRRLNKMIQSDAPQGSEPQLYSQSEIILGFQKK